MEERFEWRRLVGLGTSLLGCLLLKQERASLSVTGAMVKGRERVVSCHGCMSIGWRVGRRVACAASCRALWSSVATTDTRQRTKYTPSTADAVQSAGHRDELACGLDGSGLRVRVRGSVDVSARRQVTEVCGIHTGFTYRVGEEWLPVAGRGPAGTLCSRLMGMEIEGGKSSVPYRDRRVETRRGEWRRSGRRSQRGAGCTEVGGGHAATMEFLCFKRQVGGGQLKRYARNDATPAGNCGLGWGRRRYFSFPRPWSRKADSVR